MVALSLPSTASSINYFDANIFPGMRALLGFPISLIWFLNFHLIASVTFGLHLQLVVNLDFQLYARFF